MVQSMPHCGFLIFFAKKTTATLYPRKLKMSKSNFKISADVSNSKAVIRIDGRISQWNNYASGFKLKLDEIISQGVTDATIYINSPGGDCFEGNEIANEIIRFKGKTTAVLGALCASAATYIASKCSYVIAAKNNNYMIHKPYTLMEGNSDQVESELKLLRNLEKNYAEAYAAKTGLTVQKIESMWVQDYWMNSDEAKKLGFIDEIEGEAEITDQDVTALKAYKNAPSIVATAIEKPTTDIMKEKLILAMNLPAATTEAEALAHVDVLKVKAAKADQLEKELSTLKQTTQKEKVDAYLASCKASKKITDSQTAYWEKQLNADFEGTKAFMDTMPVAIQFTKEISGAAGTGTGEDRSKWTYADWQEKDAMGLAKLADTDEETFKKLANAHYKGNF